MAKTTISIPDGLLAEIDRRAEAAGTTRSGFVQEATAHYITTLDSEKARVEHRESVRKAIEGMREIAKRMPADFDGTAIIRKFRDAPPRWLPSEQEKRGEER